MAGVADFLSKVALTATGSARLLHVGRVAPDPEWGMRRHFHENFHELIVIEEGRFEVRIRGEKLAGAPGDMFIYPDGEPHEERSDASKPVGILFLGFEWECDPAVLPLRSRDGQGRVRLLMEWLHAGREASSPAADEVRQGILHAILALYLEGCASGDDSLVSGTRSFVRGRIGEPLSLDDLAKNAGMSKYHFLRRYRKLSGRTPMEDVRALRLEYARELILTTSLPLKAIAPMVGMSSEYALSKVFKKVLGTTPGALRRRA
jgi:AraC-like DNA-binding protein/quercetin dioxygenase-like cupin family protein